jgi:trk system potassium uptake protein TrkH
MGTTPALTTAGKLVITFLMFLGRVGPLTLAAAMAIAGRRRRVHYRYAHESVIVG